jgi:tRNA threonylcarbamoyladenosine biosynthesis protein TsaE
MVEDFGKCTSAIVLSWQYLCKVKKTFELTSEKELVEPATFLINQFKAGPILLYGEMGVGKTTFVKVICKELGVGDEVSSPTFSLIQEYMNGEGERVIHMDLYRLKDPQEALDIGIEEYLYSGDRCFVEWPDRIDGILPQESIVVKMLLIEGRRTLEIIMP